MRWAEIYINKNSV